jgi:hypothetical protein
MSTDKGTPVYVTSSNDCLSRFCLTKANWYIKVLTLLRKQLRTDSNITRQNSQWSIFLINTYIHTTHAPSLKGQQGHLRYSSETPTFYQNYLAMRNTPDLTGGKSIAVWSQSISVVSAVNSLAAFYDIHGRKRKVLFFYFVANTTRD